MRLSLFVVGWVATFHELYHSSGDTVGQFFLELRYPLPDAVLVCAMLPMVLGTVRGLRRSALVGYGTLVVIGASDVVAMVVRLHSGTIQENPADLIGSSACWCLASAPWVNAAHRTATRPERGHLVGRASRPPRRRGGGRPSSLAGHSLTDGRTLEPIVAVVAGLRRCSSC